MFDATAQKGWSQVEQIEFDQEGTIPGSGIVGGWVRPVRWVLL